MNKKTSTDILMATGVFLAFLCTVSWITGLDLLGLEVRMSLTVIAPLLLLAGFILSKVFVKQPNQATRILRIASVISFIALLVSVVVMIILLIQISQTMREF